MGSPETISHLSQGVTTEPASGSPVTTAPRSRSDDSARSGFHHGQLGKFYPEAAGHYLCPTCLRHVPLSQPEEITIAHILPRAAGGGLTTLLCKRCNSTFGSRQDRWMGEYMRLVQAKGAIDTVGQRGYFEVGGVRVGGRYRTSPDGGLEFLIRTDKTSPANLAAVTEQFRNASAKGVTLTIPLPKVFKNKESVTIGFITAAYLMWFRELGYSWALQKHLARIIHQS